LIFTVSTPHFVDSQEAERRVAHVPR
jgi:hypothetical protein